MEEKYLSNLTEELSFEEKEDLLYEKCIRVIKLKDFSQLPIIENMINPFKQMHIKISVLLYYIYFIMLSTKDRDIYYNIKAYIYEDISNINIKEYIRYYNDNIEDHFTKEEAYFSQISLKILKKFTRNKNIPDVTITNEDIDKINNYLYKTKSSKISTFALKIIMVWMGLYLNDESDIISDFNKIRALTNLHFIINQNTENTLEREDNPVLPKEKKEEQMIEEALQLKLR